MTLIKDFNELHNSLKSLLIGLLFVLPFWYLVIFLFDRQLIYDNQIQIPIILTFCLTVCHFIINLFIAFFLNSTILSGTKQSPELTFALTAFISILSLALLIYIGRQRCWTFAHFIDRTFTITFALAFVLFIITMIKGGKNNK